MSQVKKQAAANEKTEIVQLDRNLQRIASLVALLLVKGEEQSEKIRTLSAVGYSPSEISNLLGISANAVSIALHRMRKANKLG